MERGALLHDVGKIGVPDDVLRKGAELNDREWEAMQKHPLLAGLMVSKVGFLEGALPILLYHHERYDGTGYPFGLQGSAIPLEARIFTVVDAYDAMTSDRPYRDAMPSEAAMDEIRQNAGVQFDPEVVAAFEQIIVKAQPHRHQEEEAA
jgi:HD-GYP domain-containing protein (c-di-GMP phosphodiesterase class II)